MARYLLTNKLLISYKLWLCNMETALRWLMLKVSFSKIFSIWFPKSIMVAMNIQHLKFKIFVSNQILLVIRYLQIDKCYVFIGAVMKNIMKIEMKMVLVLIIQVVINLDHRKDCGLKDGLVAVKNGWNLDVKKVIIEEFQKMLQCVIV